MATLSTLSNFNGSNGSLPYDGLSIDPAGIYSAPRPRRRWGK